MKGKKIIYPAIALSLMLSQVATPLSTVYAATEGSVIALQQGTTIKGNYENAISTVKLPKYDNTGNKVDQGVTEDLKTKLATTPGVEYKAEDIEVVEDEGAKTLTTSLDLKGAFLTTEYYNGKSPAGTGYVNMMNYFTGVLQLKALLDTHPEYTVVDKTGDKVDAAYVEELLGLLNQINDIDPATNLKYDYDSTYDSEKFSSETDRGGLDLIATSKEGNVELRFHMDSHGWWGYDLGAHDSFNGLAVGMSKTDSDANQRANATEYGNFFVIELETEGPGKIFMLRGTDLENPMIYVSDDGKEALMIDTDFYGQNVLNTIIKSVIGDQCEKFNIFLTHMHGDHVNNLDVINKDEYLSKIVKIYWPENEPHSKIGDVDLVTMFGPEEPLSDMETFEACGRTFQFIEIPDEHTPGGGQLADLTEKITYIGDTLGAQVHLGGSTISTATLDAWNAGAKKTVEYSKENGIKYFIGGHTSYLNTPEYAQWMVTATEYAKQQLAQNKYWGGLVIVENGEVVEGERLGEIWATGLTDREELVILSANFRNDIVKEDEVEVPTEPDKEDEVEVPTEPDKEDEVEVPSEDVIVEPGKTEDEEIAETDKETVKTGDATSILGLSILALGSAIVTRKITKKED